MDANWIDIPPFVPMPEYVPILEPKLIARPKAVANEIALETTVKDEQESRAVNRSEDTLLFQFFQNNDDRQ